MRVIQAAAFTIVFGVSGSAVATTSVRVIDGDTLEVCGITYRLHGIDALEAGQKCAKETAGKTVRNAPADWIRVEGVIESILSRKLFLAAQQILRDRGKMPSDEELLADLKALYKRHGYFSRALIDGQANLSCSDYYRKQFGSMDRAYELAGFIRQRGRTSGAEVRRRRSLANVEMSRVQEP